MIFDKLLHISRAHKCRLIVFHIHLRGTLHRRYRTHRVLAKTQGNTRLDRDQPTRRELARLERCSCKAIIMFVKAMDHCCRTIGGLDWSERIGNGEKGYLLSHDLCKNEFCERVSMGRADQGSEGQCIRFSSSLVSVSLFLSKSKNSSGIASAVGSSSGS